MKMRQLPFHVRLLQRELDRRKEKNPRYSLRAFAQLLNVHASSLSRILAGKQDLSINACQLVLEKLQLTLTDARLFVAAVSEDKRNRALAILTRALEPKYISDTEADPKFENIIAVEDQSPLKKHDVYALEQDYVSIMDLDGRFLHANETTARLLQSIPCELIGEYWPPTVFDVQTPALLTKQQNEVVAFKKEKTFEFSVGRNENARVYRRTITPVHGADGEMNAYISTIRDVTWEKFFQTMTRKYHSSVDLTTVMDLAVRAPTPLFSDAAVLRVISKNANVAAYSREGEKAIDGERTLQDLVGAKPLIDGDVQIKDVTGSGAEGLRSAIVASLVIDKDVSGSMVFLSKRPYAETDVRVARELTQSLSAALRNAVVCSRVS